jgi:amino acid permease
VYSHEKKWIFIRKIVIVLALISAFILAQYYQWLGISIGNSYLEAKIILLPFMIILFVGEEFIKYKKKAPKEKKKRSNKKN